ncbi:hypothetical protein SDC9_97313 [bioreactor metagenome]|uniref:Uncharacterized protein n=1 Tax=bioreactor metagenome TaxID=1076179 RepID=A0A645AE55_9ZZZZ
MGNLQRLAAADQNSVGGSQSGPNHDGCGRGQPQCAGTGNHQHGGEYPQGEREFVSRHQPHGGGQHGDGHNHGNKHARHLVCNAGDGRFLPLGILHKLNDFGQSGVLSHSGHGDVQHPVAVDAAADDGTAGPLFHRQALTGEHGLVDAALPLGHGAVGGNFCPGLYQNQVSGLQGCGRHLRPGFRQNCHIGTQVHQLCDGAFGFLDVPALQKFSHHDEGQHHRRRLIIQIVDMVRNVGNQIGHGQRIQK